MRYSWKWPKISFQKLYNIRVLFNKSKGFDVQIDKSKSLDVVMKKWDVLEGIKEIVETGIIKYYLLIKYFN